MPGRFRLSGGHFEMHNADGVEVFSTRDRLFRCTNVLQGSYQFPLVAVSPGETDLSRYLGACNVNATVLLGYAKASGGTAGFSQLPSTDWWCVSTSYLHTGYAGGDFGYMTKVLAAYSFYITAGSVYLSERAVFGAFSTPQGQAANFQGPMIEYELWCGTLS